jgi:hypothetical protein
MRFFTLTLALLLTIVSFGQTSRGKIRLQVNSTDKPIENVTVELLRIKDSQLLKTSITDKEGWSELDNISYGTYYPSSFCRWLSALLDCRH